MKSMCSIDGCDRLTFGHGWCNAHYLRWRRNGDPLSLSRLRGRTAEQRFWELVDKRGPDECWPWTGGTLSGGYGSFRIANKSWPAHRWLWVQNNGPLADGSVVRHNCDNPPCCNPSHHQAGTPLQNIEDKVERDRHLRGERNVWAKLTDSDVLAIRASKGVTQKEIAALYGVTPGAVAHIVTRKTWRHLLSAEELEMPYRPMKH